MAASVARYNKVGSLHTCYKVGDPTEGDPEEGVELHGEQLAEDPGAEEGVQQRVVGHHGEAGQAAHQVTWGEHKQ